MDEEGKRYIQQIIDLSKTSELRKPPRLPGKLRRSRGTADWSPVCDVWLNTPRRPLEASGTSGQKIGCNGG